ncbi:MAG: hypothetical protein EXS16_09125 [Gemmataceae bacterium]|nr:hypothetical protein [Gemmataceae bacterium]
MIATSREAIAKTQADLVRALVHGAAIPAGFDEQRVRAVARSLVNKRRQALARIWPSLVKRVGDSFVAKFTEYGQTHPLPSSANALTDGRAFLAWLAAQEPPTDGLRIEALAYDLRWRETPLGLCRRGGFGIKIARLPQSGKWLLGLRTPWRGDRWWGMPSGD